MPKVSRNTASHAVQLEGLDVRLDHIEGGYSVCFERHTADAELGALFRGLPDDRCPLPRWGYVLKGKVGFVFPDRKETFEAGDAYYVPPGHVPVHYADADNRVQSDRRAGADDEGCDVQFAADCKRIVNDPPYAVGV